MKKIIKIVLLLSLTFSISVTEIIASEKIKIGLLIPLTGKNSDIGQSIIKSTRLAINKIDEHLQNNAYLAGEKFSRADLTAASLLAPLCQPNGYGLEWPKETPKRLKIIADEMADKLKWVDKVYKKYR